MTTKGTVIKIAQRLASNVNQLIDGGLIEDISIISSKIEEGVIIEYIIEKCEEQHIDTINFKLDLHKDALKVFNDLFSDYHQQNYSIKNNGLILIVSILVDILVDILIDNLADKPKE